MSRMLSLLARNASKRIRDGSTSSPLSVTVHARATEEPASEYRPGGYYPVLVGSIFKERYHIVKKLGWGRFSTVWLVEDELRRTVAALKILKSECTDDPAGLDELGMLRIIQQTDPTSPGYRYAVQLLDDFRLEGPNGTHICLVLEPMGLNALNMYQAFDAGIPLPVVKRMCKHLLLCLQYIHDSCDMIHTDIKPDNIMVACSQDAIGQSQTTISVENMLSFTYKLADFGHANKMTHRFAQMIQPTALRAPEVIVGAKWDTKADIWNAGCLIYELARGRQLFNPFFENSESGLNPPQTHVAQIVGLLGDFPHNLLGAGSKSSRYFGPDGCFLFSHMVSRFTFEEILAKGDIPPVEISPMADFLKCALQLDPQSRWTAEQLLKHPWISAV